MTFHQIKENFIDDYNANRLYSNQNEFYQNFYFWIFGLRIISSLNCINFEQYYDFNEFVSNEVKKNINERIKENKKFDSKWINILLDNIDPDYEDKHIISVFRYLKKIIGYSTNVKEEFKEESISLLKKILSILIQYLFNDSIIDFLNKDFTHTDDKLIEFFKNPDLQLKLEIEKDFTEKYTEIIENDFYVRELKPFYDSFVSKFSSLKKEINDKCNEDKSLTYKKFIQESENQINKLIEDKKEKSIQLIKEYQNEYKKLDNLLKDSYYLKINKILRTFNASVNKNTSINNLIKIMEEIEIINNNNHLDEKQERIIKKIIENIENAKAELFKRVIYDKYQFIRNELKKNKVERYRLDNTNEFKNLVEECINLLSKNKFEGLKDYIADKIKILKDFKKKINDIKLYESYILSNLNLQRYNKEIEKFSKELEEHKKIKEKIEQKIDKINSDIESEKAIKDKMQSNINKIVEDQANKDKLESNIKIFEKDKEIESELKTTNQKIKSIEEEIENINNNLNQNMSSDASKKDFADNLKKLEKIKKEKESLEISKNNFTNQKINKNMSIEDIEMKLKEMKEKLNIIVQNNKKIKGYNKLLEKSKKTKEEKEKDLKKQEKELEEKSKIISEINEKLEKNKKLLTSETEEKNKINLKNIYIKDKNLDISSLQKEVCNIGMLYNKVKEEIKIYFGEQQDKINNKKPIKSKEDLLKKLNYHFRTLFLNEYKEFSDIYSKIYSIYSKFQCHFSNEAMKILFVKEKQAHKVLVITYKYKERNSRNKSIEIYDKYNNYINILFNESSGNIIFNHDFYDDNTKYFFFTSNQKGSQKVYEKANVEQEIKNIELNQIDDSKIEQALLKSLEDMARINYKDDCPSLQFGSGSDLKDQEEFLELLDEYFEKLKNIGELFNIFEEDKKNKTIIRIKSKMENINNMKQMLITSTEQLRKYCKVEFSNNSYTCLGTQGAINDLLKKINQMEEYMNKLIKLINSKQLISKINKINEIKDEYEFFRRKIRLFLPKEKISDKRVDFSSLDEKSDLLKLPIISSINNSITCSYPNLRLNFGPYVSSFYSEPIIINFTSLIKTLSIMVEDIDPKFKNLLKCSYDSANGLAQLKINIPKMSHPEKDNKELFNIKCKLEFSSPNTEKCLLDCEFNIEVIPFNIIAYCKEYNLSKISDNNDDNFILYLSKIKSGKSINICFKNYNINKKLEYSFQTVEMKNNTAEKPVISKNEDSLQLTLGKENETSIKRLVCELIVRFLNSKIIKIKIDCFLIPFDFEFKIFDYNSRSFNTNLNIFLDYYYDFSKSKTTQILPQKIPLHFKVIFPNFSYSGNIKFSHTESNFIRIENNNIPKSFDSNFTFDLDLILKEDIAIYKHDTKRKELREKYFIITLNILNVEHQIKINFDFIDIYFDKEKNKIKINNKITWIECASDDNCIEYSNEIIMPYYNKAYITFYGVKNSASIIYDHFENSICYLKTDSIAGNNLLVFHIENENKGGIIQKGIGFIKKLVFGTKISYKKENSKKFPYNDAKNIPIMGYLGNSFDCWYPAFKKYDDYFCGNFITSSKNYLEILNEIKNHVIQDNPQNYEFSALALELSILGSEWKYDDKLNQLKLFLKNILEYLKDQDINDELKNILIKLEYKNINESIINEQYFNTIICLYNSFKKRYEFLKKNKYKIISSKICQETIEKKTEELLYKYFYYDNKPISKEEINNAFPKINKSILDSNDMLKCINNSEKAIIFKEGMKPLFSDKINTNYDVFKSSLNEGENLAKINIFKTDSIQDINFPPNWSIFSLNDFFIQLIKLTRELPLFAISAKIENDKDSINKTEKLYIKLLDLFESIPEEDESFIGDKTKAFNDEFTKMTNNLINSNIIFKEGVIPKKLKTNQENSATLNKQYIILPKEKSLDAVPENQWKGDFSNESNKKDKVNEIVQNIKNNTYISKEEVITASMDMEKIKNEKEEMEERKKREKRKLLERKASLNQNENEKKASENIIQIEKPKGEEKKSEKNNKENLVSNFRIKFKKNRKLSNTEIINLNKNGLNGNKNDNYADIEVNIDTTIKKETLKINISNFNFNEEIILRLVFERMREIEDKIKNNKKLPELGIKKDLECMPTYENEKPSSNNFNVKILYQKGLSLARKIIKNISQKTIPFSHISVDLLLSCSGFISLENKLKQFVIVCGIVEALNIVNINYEITVVADSQFKCTLKPFTKEHSVENLQKVLDCLFIKRFIGKHANDIQYSLNFIKPNTTFRTILLFSDGLDEDFLLYESWKNKLNIYTNYSFGFFFINSEIICNKHPNELDYLKSKWELFKKTMRDEGIHFDLMYYKSTFEDSKLYDNIAYTVTKLLERPNTEESIQIKDESIFNPPNFDLSKEDNLQSLSYFENVLEESFENNPQIYIKKTDVLKNISNAVYKLNVNNFRNRLSKITEYEMKDEKIKANIHSYAKKFIESRAKLNKAKIEAIFKPNKPSQKVLSTTGTEFDIPALIMNLINPSPDPMIYLEEKGGMIRNYSVSLIFDTSYSCLNSLCLSFSLQTLRLILSTLNSIDIPCFDFILSRQNEPDILCSNISSVKAINPKSALWESLFSILAHPCPKSDLASAIEASFDLKRIQSTEYTSYLFILTDGLYQENEHKRILRAVSNCVKSGMNVFGIGIGIYPAKIEYLFPKIIYCNNPYNVNKAIANFFGESISGLKNYMTFMEGLELNYEINLNNSITQVINDSTSLNFQSLFNKLSEIDVETDAFLLFSNQEDEMEDTNSEIKSNPKGEDKELLKKDRLKGQKILIVMLWSKALNKEENESIHKDYLTNVGPQSKACLKDALDHLGVIIEIVENYRDAIEKITSKNEQGKCPYYAVWVINGPPYDELPDGSKEGFLLGQFLEVIKLFWEKGGALIFLAEGWKLQYQTNEFLKMLDFDGKKVSFSLVGDDEEKGTKEHTGGQNLKGDKTGILKEKQQFSKKIERYGSIQRLKLDHNLFTLFEGDTICYTDTDDYKKLLPFHPFSRDSENGISSLFYLSDEKKRGDIFIDCGFTKLFINMEKDDTAFRYFQNIASWSARPEIHLLYDKIDVRDWRPDCIDYKIDINKKWTKFLPKPSGSPKIDLLKLKTLFAFDNSTSISSHYIKELYFSEINRIIKKYYKDGDKFYLWGDTFTEKTKTEIDDWIKKEKGTEGTRSENIAKIAQECQDHREHLIIVTDGRVIENSIKKSDELMLKNNIQFKFVSVYIIGEKGNLSVGAPFCRGCPNRSIQVINKNTKIKGPTLSLDEISAFNKISSLNSLNQFNDLYEKFFSIIKAKQLGKDCDNELCKKLNLLKLRILKGLNNEHTADFEMKWKNLYDMASLGVHEYNIGTAGIKKK